MRSEIKQILNEMTVEALDGHDGGRMPQQWEVVYKGERLSYHVEFAEPRRGYQGDTSRLTWYDCSKVPVGVPGQLQRGFLDTGFCKPSYRVLGGLTPEECAAVDARRDELIAASGRDLRDEFDGKDCPECGSRFCSCNGTQAYCGACEQKLRYDEWEARQRMVATIRQVVKAYRGTRLYGALRRAGLEYILTRDDRDALIEEAKA